MVSPVCTFWQSFTGIKAGHIDFQVKSVAQCTSPIAEIAKTTAGPHPCLNQRYARKTEPTCLLDSKNGAVGVVQTLKAIVKNNGLQEPRIESIRDRKKTFKDKERIVGLKDRCNFLSRELELRQLPEDIRVFLKDIKGRNQYMINSSEVNGLGGEN